MMTVKYETGSEVEGSEKQLNFIFDILVWRIELESNNLVLYFRHIHRALKESIEAPLCAISLYLFKDAKVN